MSQRLSETVQATAAADGTAIFRFGSPPTGLVYQGTFFCSTADAASVFAASVGGTPWSSWGGPSVGGPVQAWQGETVTVSASGLTSGTTYALEWTGRADDAKYVSHQYPDTNASPAASIAQAPGTSLVVGFQGGALQASVVNLAPGTASLLPTPPAGQVYLMHNASFDLLSGGTDIMIVGHSTGFVYTQFVSDSGVATVPLMGQVAAEALDVQAIGGSGGSAWLSYDLGPVPVSGGGSNVPVTFQLSHSYSVTGALTAQTLPPFFVPVIAGQTATLKAIRAQLQSGTSIALALQRNGTNISGLSAVSVTPTATTTSPTGAVDLANDDAIGAVLSTPSGSPVGLTISIYVEYT